MAFILPRKILEKLVLAVLAISPVASAAPHNGKSHVLISTPLGSAHVHNNCTFAVASNIVHAPRPGAKDGTTPEEIFSTIEPGNETSHPFLHDPNMGISWKIWRTDAGYEDHRPIQFEWTWVPEARRAWWDLSMIDAGLPEESIDAESKDVKRTFSGVKHPFNEFGMAIMPHRDGTPVTNEEGMCRQVICPAGEGVCFEAYNAPEDWTKQHDCAEDVSLKLTLCGDGAY